MKRLVPFLLIVFIQANHSFAQKTEDDAVTRVMSPHIFATNIVLLMSKTYSLYYEHIFDKKDFSLKFPVNYSNHHGFVEAGLDVKIFNDDGRYGDVSIGVIQMERALFNWYMGPSYLFTHNYLESHSALRAMGGAMVQMKTGLNVSADVAIGPGLFHTHEQRKLEGTPLKDDLFFSYTIGLNVGYRLLRK